YLHQRARVTGVEDDEAQLSGPHDRGDDAVEIDTLARGIVFNGQSRVDGKQIVDPVKPDPLTGKIDDGDFRLAGLRCERADRFLEREEAETGCLSDLEACPLQEICHGGRVGWRLGKPRQTLISGIANHQRNARGGVRRLRGGNGDKGQAGERENAADGQGSLERPLRISNVRLGYLKIGGTRQEIRCEPSYVDLL